MQAKKIKEFAKVRRGSSPRPIDDPKYFGGDVGWVRISDVTVSKKYLRSTSQYVSKLGESLSVRVDKGDLVISIAATVGKPIIIDMPACIHDGFVQIYDFKDSSTEFLYYYLQHLEKSLIRFGQSGTQTNLNIDIVNNIELNCFGKETEEKIASIIATVDNVIEQTENLIAKYERIRKGLMQDLLTKGIDEKGKIRNKATHKFKIERGAYIPQEWQMVNFQDVADKHINWSLTGGPFGSNLKAEDYSDSGVRIIQLQNIGDGEFKDDYKIYTTIEKADKLISCNIYPNEIILSKMGDPVARACFIPESEPRFLMASDGIRLAPDNRFFDPFFVLTYINYELFRSAVSKIATGSTRQRIGLLELKKMPFIKPSLVEQQRISEILKSNQAVIDREKMKRQKLLSLKTGLMQDLFSGKVRITSS